MFKKSLIGLSSAALAFALVACNEEKKAEPQQAAPAPVQAPVDNDANAILKLKVRMVVGETDLLKGGQGDAWKRLRQGIKVVENDKIRTAVESEAVLAANDGTALTVTERSEVAISAEMLNSLSRKVTVLVKSGQVLFDVQKQQNEGSFEFKTGTATAAIRGTAGFVGVAGEGENQRMFASLKEGHVEVTDEKGAKADIVENQTVVVDTKGEAKVLPLKSSGSLTLAKALDSIAATTADAAALQTSIEKFDENYAARQKAFAGKVQFLGSKIPDTVYVPTVELQARVNPGIIVTVWGQTDTVGKNGVYQRNFEWAPDAYGLKRFLATCSDGYVEVNCFTWQTMYIREGAQPQPAVEEPAPVAEAPKADKPKVEKAKALPLKVAIAGGRNESVHLDLPAAEYKTNLKINLSGITNGDLGDIKSIQVRQGGQVVGSVAANDMTSMTYEIPVSVKRNHASTFEVVVTDKSGKNFRAKKTITAYCMLSNHPGGKARNVIKPKEEELEMVTQAGQLIQD